MSEGMDAKSVVEECMAGNNAYCQPLNCANASNPLLEACITINEQALSNIEQQKDFHNSRQLAHEDRKNDNLTAAAEQNSEEAFNAKLENADQELDKAEQHNKEAVSLEDDGANTRGNLDIAERNLGAFKP